MPLTAWHEQVAATWNFPSHNAESQKTLMILNSAAFSFCFLLLHTQENFTQDFKLPLVEAMIIFLNSSTSSSPSHWASPALPSAKPHYPEAEIRHELFFLNHLLWDQSLLHPLLPSQEIFSQLISLQRPLSPLSACPLPGFFFKSRCTSQSWNHNLLQRNLWGPILPRACGESFQLVKDEKKERNHS